MKIFDCFMYFDEDMMLDIRLNILDKYVWLMSDSSKEINGQSIDCQ